MVNFSKTRRELLAGAMKGAIAVAKIIPRHQRSLKAFFLVEVSLVTAHNGIALRRKVWDMKQHPKRFRS